MSAHNGTNPLILPSKPNSIERKMEVDPGDELNPEELATAEFFWYGWLGSMVTCGVVIYFVYTILS